MALGFNSSGSYRVPCRCKVSVNRNDAARQSWPVMKRYLISVFLACLCIVGCKAQTQCTTAAPCTAPPIAATYQVNLSWTASVSCTTAAPCTYAVLRSVHGNNQWVDIQTTASQTVTAIDSSVGVGTTYDYVVEAVQNGTNSSPSNTATIAVPLVPSAATGLSVIL